MHNKLPLFLATMLNDISRLYFSKIYPLTTRSWSAIIYMLQQCGCSLVVELQPSKLIVWVRFPSSAPKKQGAQRVPFLFGQADWESKASVKKTVRRTVFSERADETIHNTLNPSDDSFALVTEKAGHRHQQQHIPAWVCAVVFYLRMMAGLEGERKENSPGDCF